MSAQRFSYTTRMPSGKKQALQARIRSKVIVYVIIVCIVFAGIAAVRYGVLPYFQTKNTLEGFEQASVERVVDGDTLVVTRASGESAKVRLIGIDTPESVHPDSSKNTQEGVSASAYVKSLLPAGTVVWLQTDTSDTDKYDRLLRYVWLEVPTDPWDRTEVAQKMLNAHLVQAGYATAKEYPPDTAYADILSAL